MDELCARLLASEAAALLSGFLGVPQHSCYADNSGDLFSITKRRQCQQDQQDDENKHDFSHCRAPDCVAETSLVSSPRAGFSGLIPFSFARAFSASASLPCFRYVLTKN